MGGAAGSSSTVYFLGNSDNKIYYETPLPMSGTENPSEGGSLPSGLGTFDIARQGDPNGRSPQDIWVATDHSDSPVRAYNMAGTLTYASDVLDDCRGMAYSSEGGTDFLWVSHPVEGMIYQLSVPTVGVAERAGALVGSTSLSASANPFAGSVTITAAHGWAQGDIEIYDLMGRRLLQAPFDGSFTWSGRDSDGTEAPAGIYVVRALGGFGSTSVIRLTRL